MIEVFVIGVGGVGGALLEQIKRQQVAEEQTYRSARLRCSQFSGAADQRAWPESGKLGAELAEAKEPFNLGRLIRR